MSMPAEPTTKGAGPARRTESPGDVVRGFLQALADDDIDAALGYIAEDIVYQNVSLPTIRGKQRFAKGARQFSSRGIGFDVRIHKLAEDGNSVLTERTDALYFRAYRTQFWVCGRFEVTDGEITLWRDYFDWQAIVVSMARGLVGLAVPSLRPRFDD
jgi:limonene-1,2-epoxide hydrolase